MQQSSKEISVYIGVCSLIFLYLLLRCIYIPLVHDEAVTFFNYINTGRFIPFYDWDSHEDANNHILNSALSYLSFKTFGDSYLAFRLPSLLFSILCFTYVWKIAQWLKALKTRWLFIVSFIGAHYFMEFFSLTRGYGMSMALLLGAVYHLFSFLKEGQTKQLIWYAVFMTLTLSANLTLVNTALISLVLIVAKMVIDRSQVKWKFCLPIVTFGVLVPLLEAIYLGLEYKKMGLLYYGKGTSYWDVTVTSFFRRFTLIDHLEIWVFPIMMAVIGACLLAFLMRLPKLKAASLSNYHMLFAIFFFGNLAASLIQTSFMAVNYPEDRTALFFFPFLVGMICFQIEFKPWLKYISLPLLFLPIQFVSSMNLKYNSFWRFERIPERFYTTVLNEFNSTGYQPTIGGYQIRQVIWDYYNHKHGGDMGRIQNRAYPMDTVSDYLIVKLGENVHWQKLYTTIDYDQCSQLHLMKREKYLKPSLVLDPLKTVWLDNSSKKYVSMGVYNGPFDYNTFYVAEFDLLYRPRYPSNNASLVFQGVDKNGKNTFFQNFSLERFRTNYDHKIDCSQKLISPPLPENTVQLKMYILNKNEEPITVIKGKVSLLKYD